MDCIMSSYDHRDPFGSSDGDTAASNAQTQAVGGVHTALSLILLTFLVYLFSLTNLDEVRQRSVYASLAKAFMFTERSQQVVVPQGQASLLSGPRQAVRELAGHLVAIGHPKAITWEGDDMVITLPNGGNSGVATSQLLGYIGRLALSAPVLVRVEAYAAETGGKRLVGAALAQAVEVARSLGSATEGLSDDRLSALGFRVPFPLPNGLEADGTWVRVVLEGMEGLL